MQKKALFAEAVDFLNGFVFPKNIIPYFFSRFWDETWTF